MALGFEQAGFDVVAATDLDPIHCAVYQQNFPLWSILCADAREIRGSDILGAIDHRRSQVDVVFGGPPCEGFSVIGKRDLDNPRNALIFHFLRLVLEIQPKYFVMENVPGLLYGAHKRFLTEVAAKYESNGYDISGFEKLNASVFGVPQRRERVFLLGYQRGLRAPRFPSPTHCVESDQPDALGLLPKTPNVWDAIGDLPVIEEYPELFDRDWLSVELKRGSEYAQKCRGELRDHNDYSYPRCYNKSIITGIGRTAHGDTSRSRFEAAEWGKIEAISRFHRLDPKGYANTLRAGTASDRGSHTAARPIHPYKPRLITTREAARLHSFPDWFRFHTTKWHGFRQVGNSVPPLLARAIASQLMQAIGVKPQKPKVPIKLQSDTSLVSLNMSEAALTFAVSRRVIEPRRRQATGKARD